MSVLVESEEANTKKVTLRRNRNVFGSLFRALAKNILTHKAEYLDSEISVSKDWKGHQTQGTPSRAHCLGGLLLYGVLKVSWCRAGHCQSAWDLRLQEALGSCSQGSHVPDARLYSLARLQQFSKNASNYKYFSLNRSMFADLGISGTFPTVPLPSAPFASNLWMMLHLWHTGTHEIKRTCWNEVTIQSFRGIKMDANDSIRLGSTYDVQQILADRFCWEVIIGKSEGKGRRRGN